MSNSSAKIFNWGFLNVDMFSFVTAKQENEALPDVIKKFEYALAKKSDITKIEKELQMILSTTN